MVVGGEPGRARWRANYRGRDDPGYTQALYRRLEAEFTADDLFMNVGGQIEPGVEFVEVLNAQVAADKRPWKFLPYF